MPGQVPGVVGYEALEEVAVGFADGSDSEGHGKVGFMVLRLLALT